MFNPVDTRQVRAMVDHKREQVATDAARVQQAVESNQTRQRNAGWIRIAVGTRVMQVGARIVGGYTSHGPHLRPGV